MEKIIIAGGRDFNDYPTLCSYVDWVLSGIDDEVTIISGCAQGADTLGERYAQEHDLPVEKYPADWENNGKQAGFMRNSEMAKVATRLIAFWDMNSKGTLDMMSKAEDKGIPIHIKTYFN